MGERSREGSVSSYVNELSGTPAQTPSISTSSSETSGAHNIDVLFSNPREMLAWEPTKPPPALGELLDSRYMLPLLFPSDPRMLAALPGKPVHKNGQDQVSLHTPSERNREHGIAWRSRNRKIREVGVGTLQWVDGVRSDARWARPAELDEEDEDELPPSYASDDPNTDHETELKINTHVTPLTRKPSGRSKGRRSLGGETTPVERS